ncbi:MAG: hypothetical protein JW952_02240 [Candidatus Eisenbacteria bacterium]|nr:hypothetical protein [Candidatus Eisenbacteria bacterium]
MEKIDRRYIFLAILLLVLVPLLVPIGLPIRVSREVQSGYDAVAEIPDGSTAYFAADYDPATMPELHPMALAALDQLFSKNCKVIGACLWPAGPPLLEDALRRIGEERYGKKYGVDFVNLGYKPGNEVAMVSVGRSIRATFPTDFYGTPVESLEVMRGAASLTDMAILVNISAGYPGTKEWVQQVQSRYHVTMVAGCTAVSTPEYYPYFQSGQLSGLIGGMAGAAEYEKLVGKLGTATRGMDAQSLGHLAIIAFIVLGNVLYFATKKKAP